MGHIKGRTWITKLDAVRVNDVIVNDEIDVVTETVIDGVRLIQDCDSVCLTVDQVKELYNAVVEGAA